jgi:NAD(P)H-hydrate epimerase
MKVLTAAEMREVDRLTIEAGIPGLLLMENAGSRVVDFLLETFEPLQAERIAVICGKGNNGGDGFVVARQLWTRKLFRNLDVFELFDPATLTGDAAVNRKALAACGCSVQRGLADESNNATVVVDAILGTGLTGPARGEALSAIQIVNTRFPLARVVALDIPSGLPSEEATEIGEVVRADYTVTFTAPKRTQVLPPTYERVGKLICVPIGSPSSLCETNAKLQLNLTAPDDLRTLFRPRPCDSNKGMYGHVLVVGGSFGKSGAPAMTGISAYRSGAGLVTVAIPESILPMVAGYRPELMTEPTHDGDKLIKLLERMTVLAIGPGLGTLPESVALTKRLYEETTLPAVVDADALNALAGNLPKTDKVRILTPHPGEMSHLTGKSTREVQADRLGIARTFASETGTVLVLKGDRTVIAFPEGEAWINPTGSPSMATGGTGDILTGMIAGLVAQHARGDWKRAVIGAVWLHGRCGELGAVKWGEEAMLAADLLDFLPEAMNEVRPQL